MPLPQRRVDLESLGYRYEGEGHCRGCGVLLLWFSTPNQKRMPMTIIPGSEDAEHQLLECHFGKCPKADLFRRPKPKGKK